MLFVLSSPIMSFMLSPNQCVSDVGSCFYSLNMSLMFTLFLSIMCLILCQCISCLNTTILSFINSFSHLPQRPWYMLSCLWDGAYKRTLAVSRKE